MKRNHFKVGAALASSLVAACGGGAGSSSSALPPSTSQSPNGTYATFTVKVPGTGSAPFLRQKQSTRRPHFITSTVQGISFNVSDATNPLLSAYSFFALTPASPGCSGSVPSGVTCTLDVVAPPGNDTFVVNLYDSATEPGGAYEISTATVTKTIVANAANTVNVVTDGIPTFAIMGFSNPYPTAAGNYPLLIDVTDPGGALIVGSYDAPVTLSDADPSGTTTLSKTSLVQASDTVGVTLNWTGVAMVSPPAEISMNSTDNILVNEIGAGMAQAGFFPNVPGVSVSPGVIYFANASSAPIVPTLALQNGASTPVSIANNCGAYVSVSGSFPAITITPHATTGALPGGAPVITGANPGSCTINFTDLAGDLTQLPVIVGQ